MFFALLRRIHVFVRSSVVVRGIPLNKIKRHFHKKIKFYVVELISRHVYFIVQLECVIKFEIIFNVFMKTPRDNIR